MRDRGDLGRLERVARLKADVELKRFAAFRRHVAGLHVEADRIARDIIAEAGRGAPSSVGEARLAHALTRRMAGERIAVEGEIGRLQPAFDAARQAAAQAYGRAEVIAALGRRMAAAQALDRTRRGA